MIGIDTNVLLRLFEQNDDPGQSARAVALVRENAPVFVGEIVLVEFVWTCLSVFRINHADARKRLEAIVTAPEFRFAHPDAVERAVKNYGQRKADFADCLIGESNFEHGCKTTLTFDLGAVKGGGFTSVP